MGTSDKDRDCSRWQSVWLPVLTFSESKVPGWGLQLVAHLLPTGPAPREEGWVDPKFCQEIRSRANPIPIAKIWALYAATEPWP